LCDDSATRTLLTPPNFLLPPQFIAKGGGSANKTFLFQQTKALLNEKSLEAFLEEKIKTLGTAGKRAALGFAFPLGCRQRWGAQFRCSAPFLTLSALTFCHTACPPYHLAVVIGGLSAELNLKTVKLASTKCVTG
jgi:fumarate hydratase class I